jgi:hypothetical protein
MSMNTVLASAEHQMLGQGVAEASHGKQSQAGFCNRHTGGITY